MPKKETSTSSDILKSLFHRSEKGFFRVLEVRNLLTADERAHLKIKKSSNQKQVIEALGTLAPPYTTGKKGRSYFILNKSVQDTLLEYIAQKPRKTIAELAKLLPMKKGTVIEETNNLIQQGTVMVRIRPTEKVELHFHPNAQLQSQQADLATSESGGAAISDPIETFKAAYDHANPGSHFVKIFKIRQHLNLPRETFNALLKTLASNEHIMLNMGNPGKLTKDEVTDSFQDEFGNLYITVSWR